MSYRPTHGPELYTTPFNSDVRGIFSLGCQGQDPLLHTPPPNLTIPLKLCFSPSLAAFMPKGVSVADDSLGSSGPDMTMASDRRTGVDEARREEIHAFLKERFNQYHQDAEEATQARRLHSLLHVFGPRFQCQFNVDVERLWCAVLSSL